jgi:hypothetical protein
MNDEQLSHPRSMDPAENAPAPNMSQRAVMQVLSVEDWKIVALLPIPVGEILLKRIHEYGWVEIRGEKYQTAIKLTQSGLAAMRSVLKKSK